MNSFTSSGQKYKMSLIHLDHVVASGLVISYFSFSYRRYRSGVSSSVSMYIEVMVDIAIWILKLG